MSSRPTAGRDRFEIDQLDAGAIRFRHGGVMDSATFLRDGDRLHLAHRGIPVAVTDLTARRAQGRCTSNGGDGKVRAAMNGRVVAVLVKPGIASAPASRC